MVNFARKVILQKKLNKKVNKHVIKKENLIRAKLKNTMFKPNQLKLFMIVYVMPRYFVLKYIHFMDHKLI